MAFDTTPRFNSNGDEMVMTLRPFRPIDLGTPVRELVVDPGTYFNQQWLDPETQGVDFESLVTIEWLEAHSGYVVVTPTDQQATMRTYNFAEEQFIQVLVAADTIAGGTPFEVLLADTDRYLRFDSAPTWSFEPYDAITEISYPDVVAQLDLLESCTVDEPLSPGDLILSEGGWTQQILRVVEPIPAGTTVDEIVATPTEFLSAEALVSCEVGLVRSVPDLWSMTGLTVLEQVQAGGLLAVRDFG